MTRQALFVATATILVLLPATLAQVASEGETAFQRFDITSEHFRFYTSGQLVFAKGNTEVRLVPLDPTSTQIVLKCAEMYFEYEADNPTTMPSHVRMEGSVDVTHPVARVTAQHARLDFKNNKVEFEGDPVINAENLEDCRAERILIDFDTGQIDMLGSATAKISPAQQQTDPSSLKAEDIKDWVAFLKEFQAQSQASAISPGKHLLGLLDANYQASIPALPVETLIQNKSELVKRLNDLLKNEKFYDANAWNGIELPAEAKTLLAQPALSGEKRTRCNRLLLEAAFPEAF